MEHVKQAILNSIEKYSYIAYNKGYNFPKIPIDFSLKGACAGKAFIRHDGTPTKMQFNLAIAERHIEHFCDSTCPHEMAHILQYMTYPRSKPHGKEWQFFCKVLTGKTMPRCHSYNIEGIKRTRKNQYKYECKCRTHDVSITRHRRILAGNIYFCKECNGDINKVNQNGVCD
jgi:SprT protein